MSLKAAGKCWMQVVSNLSVWTALGEPNRLMFNRGHPVPKKYDDDEAGIRNKTVCI